MITKNTAEKNNSRALKQLTQSPEVNGTPVAGSHDRPATKFVTVNLPASATLVMTR